MMYQSGQLLTSHAYACGGLVVQNRVPAVCVWNEGDGCQMTPLNATLRHSAHT